MAQFAIDGGVLIIGVDDKDKTKPPQLTPVDLEGSRSGSTRLLAPWSMNRCTFATRLSRRQASRARVMSS
jgi:hypothetical protein